MLKSHKTFGKEIYCTHSLRFKSLKILFIFSFSHDSWGKWSDWWFHIFLRKKLTIWHFIVITTLCVIFIYVEQPVLGFFFLGKYLLFISLGHSFLPCQNSADTTNVNKRAHIYPLLLCSTMSNSNKDSTRGLPVIIWHTDFITINTTLHKKFEANNYHVTKHPSVHTH